MSGNITSLMSVGCQWASIPARGGRRWRSASTSFKTNPLLS